MGKSKNVEERNRILKIAYGLFKDKGYHNTSFQDIAAKANVQKALVQYYFPQKEIFINLFIEQSLDFIASSIQDSGLEEENALENLYLIGYFELWYLTCNEYMEYLKYDIVSSRKNTRTVIRIVIDWALRYMELTDKDDIRALSDAITISIGGGFELVYMCFCDSQPISPKDIVDKVVLIMSAVMGIHAPNIYVGEILSENWLNEKANKLNKFMFE